MGKQAGTLSKFGKFAREELVYRAMKKTCRSAALVIGLTVTVITIAPVASRADDASVGSPIESVSPIEGRGCPVTHPADAAECGGSLPEQAMAGGNMIGEVDTDYQISSAQNDSSRTLLENLMRNGLDRNDAQLP